MMGNPFRDKHRPIVPDAAPLDEGNIPRPPTQPRAILLVMALVAACGFLYLLIMAAPSARDRGMPAVGASHPS